MAAQEEESFPDTSLAKSPPIELVTENGFCILRSWEVDRLSPPVDGKYLFLVRNPRGVERARGIEVEVARDVVAEIERYTRGRILLANSFWIYCAERQLATYLWEHDQYPFAGRLAVEQLALEDFGLALRWQTT